MKKLQFWKKLRQLKVSKNKTQLFALAVFLVSCSSLKMSLKASADIDDDPEDDIEIVLEASTEKSI